MVTVTSLRMSHVRLVSKKVSPKVKRTFYASPSFLRANEKDIASARHLIAANLKRLKKGGVIEANGFVIKRDLTGETRPGKYNEVTLRVSKSGRECFVKIGHHAGEMNALAYEKARKILKSINNEFEGYKVFVVPSHLFYEKTIKDKSKGIMVSDFFPKEKGALLHDIKLRMGETNFNRSEFGRVFWEINSLLFLRGKIMDADPYNCFYNKKEKAFYFFDVI
jgi:hypothetical protein